MSEPANGNNTVVLLARESAWGTEGTKPVQILVVPGCGMLGDTTLIPSELFGGDPNPRDAITGKQAASGDLVTVPNTTSIAYLMEFCLGTRAFDSTLHTSKLTSGTLPSLSIDESQDLTAATQYKRSLGVRVDKTSFNWNADGFQKVSMTLLGKSTTIQAGGPLATPTAALDWTTQPIFEDLQLAAADVIVNSDGSTPCAEIVSGSLDINHNHFSTHYVAGGGGIRRSLPRRRATVTGTIKTYFEDMTLYNFAKNGTYVTLSMKWIIDADNYFKLVIPRARLKRADPKIADGPSEIDFSFVASKDSVSGTSVYTVTKNLVADATYLG